MTRSTSHLKADERDPQNPTSKETITADDITQLINEGGSLSSQEMKELETHIKNLEKLTALRERLCALEDRDHEQRTYETSRTIGHSHRTSQQPAEEVPTEPSSSSESDSSDPEPNPTPDHDPRPKKRKSKSKTKGVKVTPHYTLRIESSFREWGDWKEEMN